MAANSCGFLALAIVFDKVPRSQLSNSLPLTGNNSNGDVLAIDPIRSTEADFNARVATLVKLADKANEAKAMAESVVRIDCLTMRLTKAEAASFVDDKLRQKATAKAQSCHRVATGRRSRSRLGYLRFLDVFHKVQDDQPSSLVSALPPGGLTPSLLARLSTRCGGLAPRASKTPAPLPDL